MAGLAAPGFTVCAELAPPGPPASDVEVAPPGDVEVAALGTPAGAGLVLNGDGADAPSGGVTVAVLAAGNEGELAGFVETGPVAPNVGPDTPRGGEELTLDDVEAVALTEADEPLGDAGDPLSDVAEPLPEAGEPPKEAEEPANDAGAPPAPGETAAAGEPAITGGAIGGGVVAVA